MIKTNISLSWRDGEMKRSLVIVALLAMVLVAGAAFAHGGGWNRGFNGKNCGSLSSSSCNFQQSQGERLNCNSGVSTQGKNETACGRRSSDRRYVNNSLPQEMRNKMTEIQKLNLDMRREILEEEPDMELLKELHGKIQTLRNQMDDWHFEQYIASIMKKEASKE